MKYNYHNHNLSTSYNPLPSWTSSSLSNNSFSTISHRTIKQIYSNDRGDNQNSNHGDSSDVMVIDEEVSSNVSDLDLLLTTDTTNTHTVNSNSNSNDNQLFDSSIDRKLFINSSSSHKWTTMINTDTHTLTTTMPMTITSMATVNQSSSKTPILISNHLKHNSSLLFGSDRSNIKQKSITSMMDSSPPMSNHLTTIATIANSFSAAFLPTQLQQQNNRTSISGSIDYVVDSPPLLPLHPVSSSQNNNNNNNISGDDEDYYGEWSSQDYQFMINLSIGGIIVTTFVLLLFLLWLCCSKNDRDQYSIRKVPGNLQHRKSINTSSSDSIDGVVVNQSKRRSNCSLYISNPNSEDSQPDLPSSGGSIMFQNQMACADHHYFHHHQKPITTVIRQYDVKCGDSIGGGGGGGYSSIAPRHSYDAILKPEKCSNASLLASHHHQMVINNDRTTVDGNGQQQSNRSQGSQLARNLVTYCEQQKNQQKNQRFNNKINKDLNGKRIQINSGDLKMIQVDPLLMPTTTTIYDYYDHHHHYQSNDNKSKTLPWSSYGGGDVNDDQTNPQRMPSSSTPKLNKNDNGQNSACSASIFKSLDGQVNFTKKRRNRMHNDSAAAIALNRSGLLQLMMANNSGEDDIDVSYNSVRQCSTSSMNPRITATSNTSLTYYNKICKLEKNLNKEDDGDRGGNDEENQDDWAAENSVIIARKSRYHQNSPETSSADSITLNNHPHFSSHHQQPIVVYNERTAL